MCGAIFNGKWFFTTMIQCIINSSQKANKIAHRNSTLVFNLLPYGRPSWPLSCIFLCLCPGRQLLTWSRRWLKLTCLRDGRGGISSFEVALLGAMGQALALSTEACFLCSWFFSQTRRAESEFAGPGWVWCGCPRVWTCRLVTRMSL